MGYKGPTGTTNNPALVKTSMAEFFQNIVQGGRLRKDDMSGMVRELPVHVICNRDVARAPYLCPKFHRISSPLCGSESELNAQRSAITSPMLTIYVPLQYRVTKYRYTGLK